VQGTGSSQSNGRVAHEPLALSTRWSAGPIGVLSALAGNETMTLNVLTFRRQANAEYTLTRIYTLTDTVALDVALETTTDDGALVTRSTLRFLVVSLGITDYATNLSYAWP
jgi:type VI protein secretion system component Hcp